MPSAYSLLLVLGLIAFKTTACEIPDEPLSNSIQTGFSIIVQNPSIPVVHNRIMNFRANGDDEHLVLRPEGVPTLDRLYLDNGLLRVRNIHGVIDLEYDDRDDTTKLFMTERGFHPSAIFRPVWGCDPDTDELQIRLELVSRETSPQPVIGGQIGIREVVGTYEFRYSPPLNPLLTPSFMPVNMVIFRGDPPVTTTTAGSSTITSSASFTTSTTRRVTTTPASTSASTSTPPTETLPPVSGYRFVSCWAEPESGRTLTGTYTSADDMTLTQCATTCANYQYFGTQWARECFCGNELAAGSAAAPIGQCDYRCEGDSSEFCGGSRRLSLYRKDDFTLPGHPDDIGDYELYGCVVDSPSSRALTGSSLTSSTLTLEACASFCSGFQYFGAEYSVECFCGNSFATAAPQVPLEQCTMTCGGDATQYCGNGDRLSVYRLAAS